MKVLGNISHISNKGNIIVRSDHTPALGLPVFTENKMRVGKVSDVFGPTKEPYIAIKPKSVDQVNKFEDLVGKILYTPKKSVKKWGRKKRSKK